MKMTKTDRDFMFGIKAGYRTVEQLEEFTGAEHRLAVTTCARLAREGLIVDCSGVKTTAKGRPRRYKLAALLNRGELSDYAKDIVKLAMSKCRKHEGVFGELLG